MPATSPPAAPPVASPSSPRRRGRLWAIALGALALVALGMGVVKKVRGPVVPAKVVQRGPLSQRVVVSGRVTPPSQIRVAANIPGTVTQVAVEEGDVVEAGALLVQLDAAELQAAVAQAQANVLQARARLSQLLQVMAPAQAEAVRQAELQHEQAQRRAERAAALAQAGSTSAAELEDVNSALAQAQSRLAAARTQAASTGRGGAELRLAEAAVLQADAQRSAAEARLAQAALRAPARAAVLKRDVEPGDSVSPGRILLTVARVGTTRLSVEPDEKNLAFIQKGQKALASADAFADQRFDAVVESIAPAVNPDRGTVEVKLKVPEPPPYLRPEMTVSVEIAVAHKDAALILPAEAVQDRASSPWVFKVVNGKAERAAVKLGLSGLGKVEVVEGLSEGDVVLLPPSPLSPGARVRPNFQEG